MYHARLLMTSWPSLYFKYTSIYSIYSQFIPYTKKGPGVFLESSLQLEVTLWNCKLELTRYIFLYLQPSLGALVQTAWSPLTRELNGLPHFHLQNSKPTGLELACDSSTILEFVHINVILCLCKMAQLPPRGGEVDLQEKEWEGGRLKEWRDYPHMVDWSLKHSCFVQLGSSSLRRTWHR